MRRRWLSAEEQIQAAADRYEVDVRAAGARYEAAVASILSSCIPVADVQRDDAEQTAGTGD